MRNALRLALFLALLPLAPARAEEDVLETWDRLHMAGAPVGFIHSKVRTVGGESPRIETTVHSEMDLSRMGQTAPIVSTSEPYVMQRPVAPSTNAGRSG